MVKKLMKKTLVVPFWKFFSLFRLTETATLRDCKTMMKQSTRKHCCGLDLRVWLCTLFVLFVIVVHMLLYFNAHDLISKAVFFIPQNNPDLPTSFVQKTPLKNSPWGNITQNQSIPVKTEAIPKNWTILNKLHQTFADKVVNNGADQDRGYNGTVWNKGLLSGKNTSEAKSDCGEVKFRTSDKTVIPFKPALTGRNLCSLMETMDAFTAALDQGNITYFMCGGTLLGSWRHHGLIPWDDDMDFAVLIDQRQRMYRLLMDLKPQIILEAREKLRWKLFHKDAHPIKGISWKYPFLDINFFHKNATRVWDYDTSFHAFKYPKEWIFPLKLRPFFGRMLWSPRQPEKVLRLTYNLEECKTNWYNHKKEVFVPPNEQRTVPCRKLYDLLPFVKHTPVSGGCNETLEMNGRILSYHLDSSPC